MTGLTSGCRRRRAHGAWPMTNGGMIPPRLIQVVSRTEVIACHDA
jgi:hypothetical protein